MIESWTPSKNSWNTIIIDKNCTISDDEIKRLRKEHREKVGLSENEEVIKKPETSQECLKRIIREVKRTNERKAVKSGT